MLLLAYFVKSNCMPRSILCCFWIYFMAWQQTHLWTGEWLCSQLQFVSHLQWLWAGKERIGNRTDRYYVLIEQNLHHTKGTSLFVRVISHSWLSLSPGLKSSFVCIQPGSWASRLQVWCSAISSTILKLNLCCCEILVLVALQGLNSALNHWIE